ncbi:MAG: chromate efflux transporter [Gammaproteobacteria bacterium]|nr:chromate efflux transporter [Gammaproteobacteria bacterium]
MSRPGSAAEVFSAFIRLGLTSFGGPIAHLAYFRRELVERRGWLNEADYAQLVALCQFLPGPASSQVGFALGLIRAGWAGGLAAFVAFTTPSVLALLLFALWLPTLSGEPALAAVQGLKIVALAVVAHAVLGMSRQLCFDRSRASIAALAAALVLAWTNPADQLVVVLLGGIGGMIFCSVDTPLDEHMLKVRHGPRLGFGLLAVFLALLFLLPALGQLGSEPSSTAQAANAARPLPDAWSVANAFYRSGALVFGGGHVVLPLLESAVVEPGWVSRESFLAGYGAAQAMPGPLFSIAAFLGAQIAPAADQSSALASASASASAMASALLPIALALLASVAIFMPGFLLTAGVLPVWARVARRPNAARAIAGVNAAVVGLLAAALYDPVFTGAVQQPADLAIALLAFSLLAVWRAPALLVVVFCVLARLSWTGLQLA